MNKVPARAWVAVVAGMAVNLCLGILYAWSVWKKKLLEDKERHPAGTLMEGVDAGWTYLTSSEANLAYSLCGAFFALTMIPAGRLQDRIGPRLITVLAGLFLGGGCILAGTLRSFEGLVIGFGILGGIGMGLGYAAATPAAVKWFGRERRGLIVGLIVAGYGSAALYISPLADTLIKHESFGLSGSFIALGLFFAAVIVIAAQFLRPPPPGYMVPTATVASQAAAVDWPPSKMIGTWQFYALLMMMVGAAQSGLLVIANAANIQKFTTGEVKFLIENGWLLASFGGFVNAAGRVGTGLYSDKLGRVNAYRINGLLSVACLIALPFVVEQKSVAGLFIVVAVIYWQYGGTLALIPAMTADYFGPKNLGVNYGLVFLGWGIAFFVPQLAAMIGDARDPVPYHLSAGLLTAAIVLSWFVSPPRIR